VVKELTEGSLLPATSVGGVYKVSWSSEKIVVTLADMANGSRAL